MNMHIKAILTILVAILFFAGLIFIPHTLNILLGSVMLWFAWFVYRLVLSLYGGEFPEYPWPDFLDCVFERFK